MLPPNVDLGKVFAYQFMKRRLELYHATRRNNIRKQIQAEVEALAVEHDFVTIFTSLVVVDGQVRKKRGIEKREAIKAMFEEYRHEVELLIENESEVRVRREPVTVSPHSMKTFFVLAIIAMAITTVPLRIIRLRL